MPGTSSVTLPSGAGHGHADRPGRDGQLDRRAGLDGLASARSWTRGARRSGWRAGSGRRPGGAGRSGAARTRGPRSGSPSRVPAYSSGAPRGPGMIVRAQSGVVSCEASAMWVVDRSTKRRTGSSGSSVPIPGFVSLPVTCPRSLVRGGAMARIGERGSVAGRKPSKITRSHGRPSWRCVAGPYSFGATPKSSTFGQVGKRGLEVRIALADDEDQARPVGRDDGPRPVVDGQLVGRRHDGRIAADEADLERAHVAVDVVDDHVRPGLRLERDVADLEQAAVAPQLEPSRRRARGRRSRRSRRPTA